MKPEVAETKPKKIEDYEINNAVDALIRAEEIKKDEKLWPHVQKALLKKRKAIASISDLEEISDSMQGEEMESEEEPEEEVKKA